MTEGKELFVAFVLFISLSFGWWKMWVEPRDEWRWKVIECMGDNHSEESFNECAKEVGPLG